jgi:hypothetical protein
MDLRMQAESNHIIAIIWSGSNRRLRESATPVEKFRL